MDWPLGGEDDGEETSAKERFGTLVQVVTSLGAVLVGVIGFGWIETALGRLEATGTTVTTVFGPGIGVTFLAIAILALCVALACGVLAWYRLPEPPG